MDDKKTVIYIENEDGNLQKVEVPEAMAVDLRCMLFGHSFNSVGICIRCGVRA